MDASFWHQRWASRDIGFHESEANQLLVTHFHALELEQGARVFIPLCGKSRDIAWLLAQGYNVVGAELNEGAVRELFEELGIEPVVSVGDNHIRYYERGIDVLVGDVFDISTAVLGDVDAVYDRAALVALPSVMRKQYTEHIQRVTSRAPQLLICYEYDQSLMKGPPFSIVGDEIRTHYAANYEITQLEHREVLGGVKGAVDATEFVWLLA